MYLVIAEKPSVAQSIAAVLGAKQRRDGFLEGGGYLVSWCYGHLAELADARHYNPDYEKWALKDLPIIPKPFEFTVQKDKKKQFDLLKNLLKRQDVTEVINACDAGREGELIFRNVYVLSGTNKPMKRLWISSMEDDAIREGFRQLKAGSDYDALHHAALCRAMADWLVGINASRYFSLIYGQTLNVGRVVSPTLALMVQREAEIGGFVPEPFYTVQADCGFPAATQRLKDRAEAERIAALCREKQFTVQKVERKEKQEKAPALYDLTTLQRDANRILGYTAQQTLDYLQSIYEKKAATYPRTDSRYLTDDMEDIVPDLLDIAADICGLSVTDEPLCGQICDSKKVTDHHALVPTLSADDDDLLEELVGGEWEIMKLIALELLRSVCAPYRYAETTVTLECEGIIFTAKGKTVIDPGWKCYDTEQEQKIVSLPELIEGQIFSASELSVKEGKTTPPKHYTEDTILSAMETAGEKDMPDDAERKGIGTPATRAGILEKLVSSGFVERKKSKKLTNLIPTPTGTALITVLPEQLQSPQLTAEWENKLKAIEHGKLDSDSFMEDIQDMLRELLKTYTPVPGAEVLFPSSRKNGGEIIGKCPRCGGNVTESQKGFFCDNRDCKFALWKNSSFFTKKKKQFTKPVAAALLKDGRIRLTGCYSEKTGKTYDATVLLCDDGEKTEYKLDFGKEKKA